MGHACNLAAATAAVVLLPTVLGHGAVVIPPPRNAVDKDLLPWSGVVPAVPPNVESRTGWCPVPVNPTADRHVHRDPFVAASGGTDEWRREGRGRRCVCVCLSTVLCSHRMGHCALYAVLCMHRAPPIDPH